ncbi:unnamed protein product [Notodromas monacha]|uniref:Serine/threonine-protein kinase SAK n=1 Tax=Notodromas monacha TaxID=399045 RepID=A0A7R9BTN0_9CRUS|nr:unnamed protein product [Notodromas monacha]CAG0921534.1 unnamed protein product [Notodromas monacha]
MATGTCLQDFEVGKLLGSGGFADVHRGICRATGEEVALKIMDKKKIQDMNLAKRVSNEIKLHKSLNHPSIVELLTSFEDDKYVYLILELCHEGDLQTYLKRNGGRLAERDAAVVMFHVADGLRYLQSRHIVHRDLTLRNLLVTKSGYVKIADFGLAVQLKRPNQRQMTMCGTLPSLAPEVVSKHSHGMESDIWGLGCVFYTIVVGKQPFKTNEFQKTVQKIVHEDVKIPSAVSELAQDLIRQMLTKRPEERIKLDDVLKHPFFRKWPDLKQLTGQLVMENSADSGLVTMSSNAGFQRTCQTIQEEENTRIQEFSTVSCCGHSKRSCCCPEYAPYEVLRSAPNLIASERPTRRSRSCSSNRETRNTRSLTGNCAFLGSCNRIGREPHESVSAIQRYGSTQHLHSNGTCCGDVPLCSRWLRPTRLREKTVVFTILEGGEVVLEFLHKMPENGSLRVVEVFRVSNDGLSIRMYRPKNAQFIEDGLPVEPNNSAKEEHFSFESLPEKHRKKYLRAELFVSLAKAKTPKITFFSDLAKICLMQNEPDPDYESKFYSGGKLVRMKTRGITVTTKDGSKWEIKMENEAGIFKNEAKLMWDHTQKVLEHCRSIERVLESTRTEMNCFPLVMGTPPSVNKNSRHGHRVTTSKMFGQGLSVQNSSTIPSASASRKIDVSVASCRENSYPVQARSGLRKVPEGYTRIDHIGWAAWDSDGLLTILFENGAELRVPSDSAASLEARMSSTSEWNRYPDRNSMPNAVRQLLSQVPSVLEVLTRKRSLVSATHTAPVCIR